MTIRERRRRRRRKQLIKRLAAAGLVFLTVCGVTLAIFADIHQEAAEPPFTNAVEEIPTESPTPTIEATTAPQRGKELGWDKYDEYSAARMAMAEAEGEDTEGKALVILVIYNRAKSGIFPDTVAGVISQKNAFTS